MRPDAPWRVVRREDAEPATWGDAVSGTVADRVYGRGHADGLYLCHSTIAVGAGFTLSETSWPVSLGWNAIHVLSGRFLAREPFTGMARAVLPGETLVVPPRVWHFGRSLGEDPLEMLEFIGPATPGARREALPRPHSVPLAVAWEEPHRKTGSNPRVRPLRLDASKTPGPVRLRRVQLSAHLSKDQRESHPARIAFSGEASFFVVDGRIELYSSAHSVELDAGDAALALRVARVGVATLGTAADLVVAGRFRLLPARHSIHTM